MSPAVYLHPFVPRKCLYQMDSFKDRWKLVLLVGGHKR